MGCGATRRRGVPRPKSFGSIGLGSAPLSKLSRDKSNQLFASTQGSGRLRHGITYAIFLSHLQLQPGFEIALT